MNDLLDSLKKSLNQQLKAVKKIENILNGSFVEVIDQIDKCGGRIIFLGVGKSGLIARKIASTLSSIGVASIFIHPTDAYHGDLGMLKPNDLVVFISNSGNTTEILGLVSPIKRMGLKIISIIGNTNSELAHLSDFILDASIEEEASPIKLVPMASTTVALVIGDLIACGLIVKRGFKDEDFAMLHPGGSIGKKLLTFVEDLMHKGKELPTVYLDDGFEQVLYEISSKRLGVAFVVDNSFTLFGVITDGDLRRILEKYKSEVFSLKAKDMMTKNPKTIEKKALAIKAANMMQNYSITSLAVCENNKIIGVIHIHDIMKAGVI
ncbi:KpsF/GutQ family sugar-phosphate isomerase [Desulfurella multipotens]|uniref:KpsF/GutQ family sugar-phosphate isomerase n=1 Tax=Desulfurella multipotens TaxID=79269 RepID=UPI000CB63E38|nr:KpsF/GutQ family sugar-phosphate isomerase [Desulfurella multipotens]PMP68968.1 MAG: D-arabinose 5-phosphate isomerase [Desulfurella multipotens]